MNNMNLTEDNFSMDEFAREIESQIAQKERRAAELSMAQDSLRRNSLQFEMQQKSSEKFFADIEEWNQVGPFAERATPSQQAKTAEQIEFRLSEADFIESSKLPLIANAAIETDEISTVGAEAENSELNEIPEVDMAQVFPVSLPAALCDEELIQEISRIPKKMGFKIGEVADLIGIKQYVLRYWESEFDVLKPKKAPNNQRIYTRRDVENAYIIRKLLHRDRFSIEGARSAMKELKLKVKQEKNWNTVVHKIEKYEDRIGDLLVDIRRLKSLFK
jgi:DNA-binding transcriptional MerR regulator